MTAAARSVFVFGVYLVLLGVSLMLAPNLVLAPFGFAPTSEVWLRVAGSLVAIIGFFFLVAARHELTAFFRASLFARPFLFVSLCVRRRRPRGGSMDVPGPEAGSALGAINRNCVWL